MLGLLVLLRTPLLSDRFYTLIEIRSPISAVHLMLRSRSSLSGQIENEVAIHTDLARSVDVALMGQSLTVQARCSAPGG